MPVCGARGTKSEGERSTGLDPRKEQADSNRATARPVKSFSPSRPGIKKGIFPSPTVSDGRPGASLPRPATAPLAKSAGPVTPNLARGGEAPRAAPPTPAQAPTTRHRRSSQCRGGAPTQNMEKSGVARHRSARDATPTRQQGDTRAPTASQPRACGATGCAWAWGGWKRGEAAGWSIDEDRPEKLLFWKGNRRVAVAGRRPWALKPPSDWPFQSWLRSRQCAFSSPTAQASLARSLRLGARP